MKPNISFKDGRYLVTGDLSFSRIVELRKKGEQLLLNHDNLLIDLQAVISEDNSGLSLLTAWARKANRLGKNICFVHLPSRLNSMLKLSGLDKLLPIK